MKTVSVETATLVSNVLVDNTSKQDNSEQGFTSFSKIIDGITTTSQKDLMNLSSQKDSGTVTAKNTVNTAVKSKLNNKDTSTAKEADIKEADQSQNTASMNHICEEKIDSINELEEASEKIKNILLDILNISEEDLESAMQVLGMNYLDCLDKNNLAQLLTQVSGNGNVSALITDEALYQQFNDALTLVDDVKEELLAKLGITDDELMTAIDQIKNMDADIEPVNTSVDQSQTQETIKNDVPAVVEATKESVSNNIVKADDTTMKQDKVITDSTDQVSNQPDKIKTISSDMQESNDQDLSSENELTAKQSDMVEIEDNADDRYQEFTLGQEKTENVLNNLEEINPVNEKTTVDVENLVKQIESQIKLSANADTTKMEFQLNPEHLGKLTIQVASKEGVITAQITAQNLAVKEVIESQIVHLKDNMNNQGLKVDAVEVTVESHEFERNLEEGNSNTNQEQFEQQQKNTKRQFRFNDLDNLEELSAEEAILAEMMIGNGNSVNYSA